MGILVHIEPFDITLLATALLRRLSSINGDVTIFDVFGLALGATVGWRLLLWLLGDLALLGLGWLIGHASHNLDLTLDFFVGEVGLVVHAVTLQGAGGNQIDLKLVEDLLDTQLLLTEQTLGCANELIDYRFDIILSDLESDLEAGLLGDFLLRLESSALLAFALDVGSFRFALIALHICHLDLGEW